MAIVIQTLQNKCKKQSKKTKHSQVRKKVNECFPHRLLTVVRVIESAEADSITGKFETKAQILGMRPIGASAVLTVAVEILAFNL